MIKSILISFLISSQAFAGLPPTSVRGQSDTSDKVKFNFQTPNSQMTDLGGTKTLIETGNGNLLKNPGFEASTFDSGWTCVSAGQQLAGTASKGKQSLDFRSTTATGRCYQDVAAQSADVGRMGEFTLSGEVTGAGLTHNLFLQVLDPASPSTVLGETQIVFNASGKAVTTVNYQILASTRVQITTKDATSDFAKFDEGYWGVARNIATAPSNAVGTILPTSVGSCDSNSLLADGSAISRSSYASLFSVIGTTYGSGDGSTTFNLPDYRNVFIRGANASTRTIGGISYPAVTLGSTVNDKFQGHWHSASNTASPLTSPKGSAVASGSFDTVASLNNDKSAMTAAYVSDGTNGTPRTGSETAPVYAGANFCVVVNGYSASAFSVSNAGYDWTAYTPTFTGFGTVTNIECQHRRLGGSSNVDLRCKFTSGTSTAVEGRVSLPGSLVSAGAQVITSLQLCGDTVRNVAVSGYYRNSTLCEPSVSYVTFGVQLTGLNALTKANGNDLLSSGETFSFTASVPIAGWQASSNSYLIPGNVYSSYNGYLRTEIASISTGCLISNNTPAITGCSGTTSKTVTFTAFSGTPVCTVSPFGISNNYFADVTSKTSSSVTVATGDSNNGAPVNQAFELICVGPK